jgi:hypothetical protein
VCLVKVCLVQRAFTSTVMYRYVWYFVCDFSFCVVVAGTQVVARHHALHAVIGQAGQGSGGEGRGEEGRRGKGRGGEGRGGEARCFTQPWHNTS